MFTTRFTGLGSQEGKNKGQRCQGSEYHYGGEIVQPVVGDAPEITARFRDGGNMIGLCQERSKVILYPRKNKEFCELEKAIEKPLAASDGLATSATPAHSASSASDAETHKR